MQKSSTSTMASFENKSVIVTGCSNGVGLATVLLFLSRNARVFGIDIAPFTHSLDATQSANFTFHQADLCSPNAACDAVAACTAKHGPKIDVLANVAGIMDNFESVDTLQDSVWDRVMAINLTAPVRMMSAVIASMKEHKDGAIVNVGSRASLSGATAGVAYTASKHGLIGATKNVAWRFKQEGIRCNAVLPGGVSDTNISASLDMTKMDQVGYQQYMPVHNLNQHTVAEEVAQGIVFLASDHAKSMSGVIMPIDNAWSTI
ncbi:short-chain dehydrogenase reductase sdr [Pyrenophora seminiperda CCB06]|uniref:Short-chain dehydrogenase reductase sdr n=1 Tax=Pyrenophora seminiperda CCB06 TaxID=1302712 RepID=A0A3M7MBC2_9PLEO|nr:short-chain dehydrogenase reductase sdr [Pyrenophora seminiperda CCB06]